MTSAPATAAHKPAARPLGSMALMALGVVFGDLGTSPLYALHDTFAGSHAVAVTRDNVLGVLSLFVWSLVIVVSVKYLTVLMRADNRGEGGIFALLALTGAARMTAHVNGDGARRREHRGGRQLAAAIVALGIAGAALLYGDGIITPAISVLSAVEGLTVATFRFEPYVVPLTVVILVGLFALQPVGSGRIGRVFGPVLALWFVVIAAIGVWGIARDPAILAAIDPRYAVRFFALHGWRGIPVLGAVVLCLTGTEALYADMGHFGKRPIRFAWFTLVFPSLLLSYLGEGAVLLTDPTARENPFFRSTPAWSLYPLVALATIATIIASQALISAVFSMTNQAIRLELSPRLRVVHTSTAAVGQIYMPALNWLLMLACLALVIGFRSSVRLAAAYGLAVSGTMAITTILLIAVARWRWRWGVARIAGVAGVFLLIDLAFLVANLLKIPNGGWIPLVIGAAIYVILSTWHRGRILLRLAEARAGGAAEGLHAVIASIVHGHAVRVRGTAVYMHRFEHGVPVSFLHNLKHNKVVHERVVFVTVLTEEVPFVDLAERARVTPLADGFWAVVARYGYMEVPRLTAILEQAAVSGLPYRPNETSYFFGRVAIVPSEKPGMASWRGRLFAVMMRNSPPAPAYFGLPPGQVVELGAEVEM